ncbi:3-oxoacyl-[acyl-carrier-protein] synthase II, chloroplastic-like isoform X2 [Primulina huaijiensis]|uniref:3-oxoacyl-[acyl-carrier-protein] synthase II, chloroplastic-like isoform X2 n=1 Tax=Primulina huaijiensis TaxID=1492673 RepID=UPI003CC77998
MVMTASFASPLCTWLVATTCMNEPSEKERIPKSAEFARSSKKLSNTARRRNFESKNGGSSLSSFRGYKIQSLMSFCPFKPCEEYNNSPGISSSFSLFGSKAVPIIHKQRRLSKSSRSGKTMAAAVQPVKQVATDKSVLTKKRRVVVTGLGVVSSLGQDVDEFYNNLLEGISGISQIEAFDCSEFPTRIAGEIKNFSSNGWVSQKLSKRADNYVLYLIKAGKKALADGGITEEVMNELDKAKCGVIIGSALGGLKVFTDGVEALQVSHKKMNPFSIPFATTNMGSALLAMDLGWMGPNYSISTACATSNFCILSAANHIIRGETDMMLCGGSDAAIIPIGLGGFIACGSLSQRNEDPTKASRPWDMQRDGFVMGEGAGVLLLEELEHAKALAQSGVAREDINYINAHATSTPSADLKEYQAILRCFGQNTELRINSTKCMLGHLLGAAGAVEAVATVKAIQTGWIHPNINLEYPDEGVDANILVGLKRERVDVKVALSNSLGFGGHNSSILFGPYKKIGY